VLLALALLALPHMLEQVLQALPVMPQAKAVASGLLRLPRLHVKLLAASVAAPEL
jgi:hypothetical protein